MPASPSRRTSAKTAAPAERSRPLWPLVLVGVVVAGAVLLTALPASLLTRVLPPQVQASDISGSLWHGSAGKLSALGRDAGAVEWRLHPGALLHLSVEMDLHWVRSNLAVNATATVDRHGITARDITGGGSLEELRDFGALADLHGNIQLNLSQVSSDYKRLESIAGEVRLTDVGSARLAAGADLGSYVLKFAGGAVDANGTVTGQINDAGGPLQVTGVVSFSPAEHRGSLSATLLERATMPTELRNEIQTLAQLRGRDLQGRIPADLEFSF